MKKTPSSQSASPSSTTRQFVLGTIAGVAFASAVVWALIPAKTGVQGQTATVAEAAAVAPVEAPAAATEFKRTAVDDAKGLVDRAEVTVIDVRDADSYIAGHIPGALHIPLPRIEGEIPHLPKGKPILTYCTCPAEETSGAAAQILERGGVQATALTGGLGAWRDRGFPLASGTE